MKITWEELGEYLGTRASEYFERYYSSNIRDWAEDIRICDSYCDYLIGGEVIETNKCYVEVSEVNKPPLIIEWEEKLYFSSVEDYECLNYYEYEYVI